MTRSSAIAFAAVCLLVSRRRGRGAQRERSVTLHGMPDSRRRPADGIVAEASIVAHLLRLRLLTLDATVIVSPAVVTARSRRQPERPSGPPTRDGAARAQATTAPHTEPLGRRLAQAARVVDESAATLAATRRGEPRPKVSL